jgi:hypothetical protein
MPTISRELRNQLSRVTLQARTAAEAACRAALENLAVHEKDYRGHMSVEQRQLRNRLRARGRSLGDSLDERSGKQEIKHLSEDAAYEHWHRLLFTRFLAENNMLHDDDLVTPSPVTLEDCEELAPNMGAKDGFELACRFASRILPGVFRTDDPVFELTLALNDQVELRGLLDSLPGEVFTADDSLGWTYQFWQTQRKVEVNKSEQKIGADEISPVTQLFTEDYMVEFLLHNALGAWWAGKLGPIHAGSEEEARAKAALPPRNGLQGIAWIYLRFIQDEKTKTWSPTAGIFDGWPQQAAEITFLDPSMGSGHFPVFALPILARLRMEEETLSAKDAVFAVLRDNIHGLELDQRCCQIGAFNLALSAWKLAKYQPLPSLHIACCGLAPQAKKEDWLKLAGDNDKLRRGMARLYQLFEQAPVLGSLINPRSSGNGDLLEASFDKLAPLLEKALVDERADDTSHELAVTAQGIAKAAEILAGQFTLVATNYPFLLAGKQEPVLKAHTETYYPEGKNDLATCFLLRSQAFLKEGGTQSIVIPHAWLFMSPTYVELRENLLANTKWNILAWLGARAFETISGEVVQVALVSFSNRRPVAGSVFFGFDARDEKNANSKSIFIKDRDGVKVDQLGQLANPENRVVLGKAIGSQLLGTHADSYIGLQTGDNPKFVQELWEGFVDGTVWKYFQCPVQEREHYGGRQCRLRWDGGAGDLSLFGQIKGTAAWNVKGIAVRLMSDLPPTLYDGAIFEQSSAVLVPKQKDAFAAIWCFCFSSAFKKEVQRIDKAIKITNKTFEKIAFDLAYWQKVAAEKYPDGLPKPHSDDPTQWLFNGHPKGSDQPLHVAVARLCGYRWPRQTGSSFPDCPALGPDGLESFADEDGIVCLPALNREQPAAARLRALLAAAHGTFDEKKLIAATGSKAGTLEDWLRDEFFEQHVKLFDHRPFIWHLWDGRKDGFSVLVNYHRLDHATLQKLTYTYLGNWIHDQESDAKANKPGAAERLGAAQALQAELAKILGGEAPYDIFVRWKPLKDQAIGWHPDLNDGVRLNIRPFLVAKDMGKKGVGILRAKPNVKWDKDRGKEPERTKSDYPWFWCEEEPGTDPTGGRTFTGHRWNDVHLKLAFKNGGHA